MIVHLDFETISDVDLKRMGLERYSLSPFTDALCMAFAFDQGPVSLWKKGAIDPKKLLDFVRNGGTVAAHNAGFELAIWNNVMVRKYNWPYLNPKNVYCTLAKAYVMSLPGALANVATALGLEARKDQKGHRIMLQLSKPRSFDAEGVPVFWDVDKAETLREKERISEKFQTLYAYCVQDVEVEREVDSRTLELSAVEKQIWQLDYAINQRGIGLDIKAAKTALQIVDAEKEQLNLDIRELTNNFVAVCSETARIKMWLETQGVVTESVDKTHVIELLDDPSVPENCKKVLRLRQKAGKTSTAKLEVMINCVGNDNRIRNTLQYHGAGTGRWAGRKLQVHNLPSPTIDQKDIEIIFSWLEKHEHEKCLTLIDMFYGNPVKRISDCLRGFIKAKEGHTLIAGDWSAIEARVLAWLAGEDRVLKVFREGGDIYINEAAGIYKIEPIKVDSGKRQVGKVAVLALGYQGGVVAFQSMAKNYRLKIENDKADKIKIAWRDNNQFIVRFWYDLEAAAYKAVSTPGKAFHAGHPGRSVQFKKKGSFLWCQLPSKRVLCYPYPEINIVETPWGAEKEAVTFMGENSLTRKWERQKTYGGFLAENITQAVARDILANCLLKLEANDFKTIMHVHDEIICEVSEDNVRKKEFEDIMISPPRWAKDLPLSADAWVGKRYRK